MIYLVLFSVATMLAGIAVLLDSPILILGAMIVGPEFGAVAGICAGVVLSRWREARRSLVALAVGFPVGIVATILSTWLLTGLGLIDSRALFRPRPQTEFIPLPPPSACRRWGPRRSSAGPPTAGSAAGR